MDLYKSLQAPHLHEKVGRVPGITAWKACLAWWWVPSAWMAGIRYSGSYWRYYHYHFYLKLLVNQSRSLALRRGIP